MKQTMKTWIGAMALAALTCGAAVAQGPGGPDDPGGQGGPGDFGGPRRGGPGGGPGGRGFGGPGGPGEPGGPRGFGRPMDPAREMTAADLPLPMLSRELKLSGEQRDRIAEIVGGLRGGFRGGRGGMMARRPGGPPPEEGAPPAGERPDRERMHAREQAVSKKIEAVLDGGQKEKLARLVRDANDFRTVGIPMQAAPALKLTADQRGKIGAAAEKAHKALQQTIDKKNDEEPGRPDRIAVRRALRQAHEATMAVLTEEQKDALDQWMEEHPGGPMFGGPGNGGPGRGPGFNGPDRGPGFGGPGAPGGRNGFGRRGGPGGPDDQGGPAGPPRGERGGPDGPPPPGDREGPDGPPPFERGAAPDGPGGGPGAPPDGGDGI